MRAALLAVLVAGGGAWGLWESLNPPPRQKPAAVSEPPRGEVVIHIPKGMVFKEVARLLERKGVITQPYTFYFLAWWRGWREDIRYGEYVFQAPTPPLQVLKTLVRGQARLHSVTFPEGYNVFEMAGLLEREGFLSRGRFLSLVRDPDLILRLLNEHPISLEGYLFPDTYFFPRPVSEEEVLKTMVGKFFEVYEKLKNQTSPPPLPLSRHEILTLASLVEKETGAGEERPLIASVFYNRLKKGMRLESDPTIIYGMMVESGGEPVFNIRKQDILRRTAYNTYRIKGFPPSPIGNPGLEALKAVF